MGSAFIRQAIISNVQSHPLYIGDVIVNAPGSRGTESDALTERFNQDTDTLAANYQQYQASIEADTANGRRLVVVPVNDPANDVVLGFALFLLHSDVCGTSNVAPCCAEYVSNSPLIPGRNGNGNPGAHKVKLFR